MTGYNRACRFEAPSGSLRVRYGRGGRGARSRALVGATLFHGFDRDTAAQQIDTQLYGLVQAVLTAAGADSTLVLRDPTDKTRVTSDPKWQEHVLASRAAIDKSPYHALWYDAVSPTWNEWAAFYHDRRKWYDAYTELFTSWEDYQSWYDRAEALRSQIEHAGIKLAVPPLHPLPRSAQDVAEDAAATIAKVAKYALYGGIVLGGALGAVEIVRLARDTGKRR